MKRRIAASFTSLLWGLFTYVGYNLTSSVAMLALGEQSSQWLLDLEKNKSLYTDALLDAFKRKNMACEPLSATPYPTRFAFEFTYQCAN